MQWLGWSSCCGVQSQEQGSQFSASHYLLHSMNPHKRGFQETEEWNLQPYTLYQIQTLNELLLSHVQKEDKHLTRQMM